MILLNLELHSLFSKAYSLDDILGGKQNASFSYQPIYSIHGSWFLPYFYLRESTSSITCIQSLFSLYFIVVDQNLYNIHRYVQGYLFIFLLFWIACVIFVNLYNCTLQERTHLHVYWRQNGHFVHDAWNWLSVGWGMIVHVGGARPYTLEIRKNNYNVMYACSWGSVWLYIVFKSWIRTFWWSIIMVFATKPLLHSCTRAPWLFKVLFCQNKKKHNILDWVLLHLLYPEKIESWERTLVWLESVKRRVGIFRNAQCHGKTMLSLDNKYGDKFSILMYDYDTKGCMPIHNQ